MVTLGLFLLPLVRPITVVEAVEEAVEEALLPLVRRQPWMGEGGESRRGRRRQHAPGTHLPRAKRNRKFFILTGLFLSSNIFIQIPVKTTSDTGYATMV